MGRCGGKISTKYISACQKDELQKHINEFKQDEETLSEAWKRFQIRIRKCPPHGYDLYHQVMFFYHGTTPHTR